MVLEQLFTLICKERVNIKSLDDAIKRHEGRFYEVWHFIIVLQLLGIIIFPQPRLIQTV
jgi:hypothetical protein